MAMIDRVRAHSNVSDKYDDVWDEGEDGKWAVLKPGLISGELHCVHEWTWKDVLRAVRAAVPCDCDECKEGGA